MRDLAVVTESIFFRDLAYVFLAAVVGGALARFARQPLILGYVLGGILISPLTPAAGSRCPMLVFTDPRAQRCWPTPYTSVRLAN